MSSRRGAILWVAWWAAFAPACVFTPPTATGPIPFDALPNPDAIATDNGTEEDADAGAGSDADAGEPDAFDPDAVEIDSGPIDTGPADTGLKNDGGLFPYRPSNFTVPQAQSFGGDARLDCGITTLNSSTNVLNNWCGPQPQISVVTQLDGPDIVVLAMRSFVIEDGAVLRVGGNRPVIFAVLGDATIFGGITSDATGIGSGAGASIAQFCGLSAGRDGLMTANNGGGGGGGGAGEEGGDGGLGGTGGLFGERGLVLGSPEITPLRGGCNGGRGGPSLTGPGGPGGGGGGGIQISAAGRLLIQGLISARGGGGRGGSGRDGGGGGGSGGLILLEADTIEVRGSTTAIAANGGGGGEGGTAGGSAGGNGLDGRTDQMAAGGGNGSTSGGDGGDGATAMSDVTGGGLGSGGSGGGGGGGGAVGRLRLNAVSGCIFSDAPILTPGATSNRAPGCP